MFDRSKVKEFNYQEKQVELKTTEGLRIRCRNLVNATGFEVVNYISKDIVDLYCTYAVISENETEKDAL